MTKRAFFVLSLTIAAMLLIGCDPNESGGDVDRDMPPPPSAPAASTPSPAPQAQSSVQLLESESRTFGETTYTLTTEFDEYEWPSIRLLAREDDGWEATTVYDGYFMSAFRCEGENGVCILLSVDVGGSDNCMTYALDAGSLAETARMGGYVQSIYRGVVTLYDYIDVLGTHAVFRDYVLGDGLTLTPIAEGLYYVTQDDYFFVTTRALSVELYENGAFRDDILHAGTELCVTSTDARSIVYFSTRDGRAGRFGIAIRPEPWAILIDGLPEEEWFAELIYMG